MVFAALIRRRHERYQARNRTRSYRLCFALQEKHFQERTAELQISPLRYALVEMTKGRVVERSAVQQSFLGSVFLAERNPFSADLMRQGEAKEITTGGYAYKLFAIHGVAHGRGVQGLPGIEVP
jgi:hypothetical protein